MSTVALKEFTRHANVSVAAVALGCASAVGFADDRPGKRIVIPKTGERCVKDARRVEALA